MTLYRLRRHPARRGPVRPYAGGAARLMPGRTPRCRALPGLDGRRRPLRRHLHEARRHTRARMPPPRGRWRPGWHSSRPSAGTPRRRFSPTPTPTPTPTRARPRPTPVRRPRRCHATSQVPPLPAATEAAQRPAPRAARRAIVPWSPPRCSAGTRRRNGPHRSAARSGAPPRPRRPPPVRDRWHPLPAHCARTSWPHGDAAPGRDRATHAEVERAAGRRRAGGSATTRARRPSRFFGLNNHLESTRWLLRQATTSPPRPGTRPAVRMTSLLAPDASHWPHRLLSRSNASWPGLYGPVAVLLVSAAGRLRAQPISKQTLSHPTFLATSPASLRQAAIRYLVQLGVDGLELGAHTGLQLKRVHAYEHAFGVTGAGHDLCWKPRSWVCLPNRRVDCLPTHHVPCGQHRQASWHTRAATASRRRAHLGDLAWPASGSTWGRYAPWGRGR